MLDDEHRVMIVGSLIPPQERVDELKDQIKITVPSVVGLESQFSICMTISNPGEQEQAEAAMENVLFQFDPDHQYKHVINSGPSDNGVRCDETDKSLT